jgi:CHAT domain-containing protein/tetratricopeptide (TPR) repeat protein
VVTRPVDRHLDSDELDALLSSHVPGDAGRLSEQEVREAQRHVEYCQDCDRKLQMHRSAQNLISQRTTGKPANGPNCPDESEWVKIAAGLVEEAEAKERMKHAAQCGHCGPLLKVAAETLSDETSPDEEAVLANLISGRSDWQAQMAETLKNEVRPRRVSQSPVAFWKTFLYGPRSAFAAAAAIVLIAAAGWIGVRLLRPASAEQLLAQAYTERRTIDVRIPGAKYAPLRVERSANGSSFDKPETLLKAEALISERLRENPSNTNWLGAKARADLLDGNYDDAIKTLQRALESTPDSPQLLTDLGSAYFLRAKSAGRPSDFGDAIESFGKSLARSPNDPIALFNRALACEQMFLYTQAIDDWQHYLRIDPQGEWSEEAKSRLATVQDKLRRQQAVRREPLLTPAEIAKAGSENVAVQEKIDERFEQYLHIAITDWLPQAFPERSSDASRDARIALLELSEIAQRRHADRWLADLLAGSTSGLFTPAANALAMSVQANDRGDYTEGQKAAHRSALLFAETTNSAGEIRAQAEEVYSDHLLWEGPRCLALLSRMSSLLNQSSYAWIQAQMSLEESNCANAVGDLGRYQSAITVGLSRAKKHNYVALNLRALGFQALSYGSAGDSDTAFAMTAEGLKLFWSGHADLMKGYNLYFNLESVVEGLHLPYFQVALLREATALIDEHPDVLQRAMAHRWYGNAAYLANLPQLAASEFSKASALFAASPQTPATARDYMDAEVWLAHAEIEQGDLEPAAARLQAIRSSLDRAPSFDPEIGFYTAQADIAMRRADSMAADSAVRSAVFLAEWALTSYRSDEDRRHWAEQTRSTYQEAVEWKVRQGDASAALELWEWYRGADLRAGEPLHNSSPTTPRIADPPDPRDAPALPHPTLVSDRSPLIHDETVVAYAVLPDGIAIWVYDDRGVFSHWVTTSSSQTKELVSSFERLCSDRTSDLVTLRATGRLLYNLLVAPVEKQLQPGRTVLFEPDDSLIGIPWDALVDGESHYLAERVAIVVAPDLYHAMRLRASTPITPSARTLVVSVSSAEQLTPLSDADNEAETVTDKFSSARWLRGSDATLTSIHHELLGATVFHFAGHAISSPLRNGLVLDEIDPNSGRSRLITAESFVRGGIGNLQLAVLSACHTGGQAQGGNTGTENLVDTLLRSGVPHVVASLWDVDSRETAELMKEFYSHLLDGYDTAHALRAARLKLASRLTSIHPYYWSAFELHGTA